jgi:hypothetical protein
MTDDVVSSVISLLESDTIDSELVATHDPTCLKTLVGWGDSATDKRIFRLQKETPIVVNCIFLQDAIDEDSAAPGSTEDRASVDTITLTIVSYSGATAKAIWRRTKDLMRVGPKDPSDSRIFLIKRLAANEVYDEGTKTYRWIARYRIRSIENE